MRAQGLQYRCLLLIASVAIIPSIVKAEQPNSAANLDQIVTRMEQARLQSKQAGSFLLTREYLMFHGDDAKPSSQVKAEINVASAHDLDYKIVETKGSDRGEKIVRKILDHEASTEKSNPSPSAIIRANYDFGFVGEASFQGSRCYVLSLHPKRKDSSLVTGQIWIDANTYRQRKIEGELVKSPSWMVKNVKLNILFGEMSGVWTQVATNATADVRLVGKYTMNGRALAVQPAVSVAAARPQKKIRPRSRPSFPAEALYNTGITLTR